MIDSDFLNSDDLRVTIDKAGLPEWLRRRGVRWQILKANYTWVYVFNDITADLLWAHLFRWLVTRGLKPVLVLQERTLPAERWLVTMEGRPWVAGATVLQVLAAAVRGSSKMEPTERKTRCSS